MTCETVAKGTYTCLYYFYSHSMRTLFKIVLDNLILIRDSTFLRAFSERCCSFDYRP